ncbi:NAD(P)-binding domain-containing protein [Corynebacterium guangdongense]|uniref:Flavoprotein involved in K+ transport n=1 Tax=Corynebacterium guangdongense TaxID=1783348 RepID=A0ABU1ZU25_9CORY|nr:NAD(P)-binding domain-containing protein [Corynebacterium guangdongense]MDR7328434.1 putative flavoprotein involved in K+ transport [Corynebacterium guangdongense]WJZ17011.1 putative oxidoreductase CzcO [Corynebacterium guangdongense]
MTHDCIIIGAGQAGLASAFYLRRQGVEPLLLDAQASPGGAWLHVWPSMTLFSTADFSNLPGMAMPAYRGFPSASHVVDYFTRYERRYGFDVRRPVRVGCVTHDGSEFTVETDSGTFTARTVVAATGTWETPFIPYYPGSLARPGGDVRQWHSAVYPGLAPFRGARVAVVGAANSAAQIAAELTLDEAVGEVTWYTRSAPRWMPDDVDGRVLFQRNSVRALAILRGEADPGNDTELGDIVMLPAVRQARDSGALRATPMFTSLDEVDADHLIWCTGFRPALGPVRGLLDARRSPTVGGLFLVGYGDWVGPGAATIVGVSPVARAAAESVAAFLRADAAERR